MPRVLNQNATPLYDTLKSRKIQADFLNIFQIMNYLFIKPTDEEQGKKNDITTFKIMTYDERP